MSGRREGKAALEPSGTMGIPSTPRQPILRDTPMPCRIEEAQPTDAPQIARLVNQAYRPAEHVRGWTHENGLVTGQRTTAEQVGQLFTDGSSILVMRQNGVVVACVQVEQDADACFINMLATSPALQGTGIGKQMIAAAEALAVSKYAAVLLKMSVVSARPELLAYYHRRGYTPSGHVAPYPVHEGVGTPVREGLQLLELQKHADKSAQWGQQKAIVDCGQTQ